MTDKVTELNDLVREKRLAEGIERFYAEDVEMFESTGQSTKGRTANIERERSFESGLSRWDARLHSTAVDEARGVAYNHWTIHFDHAQFGSGVLEQIAVQQWHDGKIVREAFYKL